MILQDVDKGNGETLAQAVERQITGRTWGRVRHLHVDLRGGRVAVHGVTRSYYEKQLAIQAVYEALGEATLAPVDIHIEVQAV